MNNTKMLAILLQVFSFSFQMYIELYDNDSQYNSDVILINEILNNDYNESEVDNEELFNGYKWRLMNR